MEDPHEHLLQSMVYAESNFDLGLNIPNDEEVECEEFEASEEVKGAFGSHTPHEFEVGG